MIGFGQEAGQQHDLELAEVLPLVTSDDILQFGLIPELIGRLPVLSALTPLDSDDLVRVLTEPKNALVKQYQELFAMENSELEFTERALRAVAERAQEKETGARAFRSIIEDVMLDIFFELPEQPAGPKYQITEDVVYGRQQLFPSPDPKPKSA